MNGIENVPEILRMRSGCVGDQRFSIERLKEISICLSTLNGSFGAPIFEALVCQGDLYGKLSEYRTVLVNCLIDCIRLALPFKHEYIIEISNTKGGRSRGGRHGIQVISDRILVVILEHIRELRGWAADKQIEDIGEPDLGRNFAAYIYSIQRMVEDGARVMTFLLENASDDMRNSSTLELFDGFLALYVGSLYEKATKHIAKICMDAISGILVSSESTSLKGDLVLALLLKISETVSTGGRSSEQGKDTKEFLDNTNLILLKVGVSRISHFTNAILTESVRFLRRKALIPTGPGRKGGGSTAVRCWWRDESLLVPGFIRGNKNQKEQCLKQSVMDVVHFLAGLNDELIQSVITQLICDLREKDDKLRLETVKMVTRLITLGFNSERGFGDIYDTGCSETSMHGDTGSRRLKESLLESWISRANDRVGEIRAQVFLGLEEVMKGFIERQSLSCGKLSYFEVLLLKFIISNGHISCPNIREKMLIAISSWLTAYKQRGCLEHKELAENCLQYLLSHICDRSRSIRIYLIRYFKSYSDRLPDVPKHLWLLWYVSFKKEDFQMKSIIEDVLIELDPLQVLDYYLLKVDPTQQSSLQNSHASKEASTDKESDSAINEYKQNE